MADEELYKLRVLEHEMNHPDLYIPITEDWIFLAQMESAVGYSARTPNGQHWKSPAHRYGFYEDVSDNVEGLLTNENTHRIQRAINTDKGLAHFNSNMDLHILCLILHR